MISRSEFEASQTGKIITLCFSLKNLRDLGNSFEPDSARILEILERDIHKEMDYLISSFGSQKFLLTSKNLIINIKDKIDLIEMLSGVLPGAQKICVALKEMNNVINSLIASEKDSSFSFTSNS